MMMGRQRSDTMLSVDGFLSGLRFIGTGESPFIFEAS